MKKMILAAFATLSMVQSAHATHAYATRVCQSSRLTLAYDGPGSNRIVGGAYTLRIRGEEDNMVLAGIEQEDQKLNDDYGHDKLEVIFKEISNEQVGQSEYTGVDQEECRSAGVAFDSTKSKSKMKVQIVALTESAAAALKLKAGQMIKMNCEEELQTPVRCEK